MNVGELLQWNSDKYGDKPFLCYGDEKVSYSEFNLITNRFANAFIKMGVAKGDMVAVMLPNCPEFLYCWMGANKMGAIEVPVNTSFKEKELEYLLEHSEAACLVIDEIHYPIFENLDRDKFPRLKSVIFRGGKPAPLGTVPLAGFFEVDPIASVVDISDSDPAVCIYTSGTTDRPKGVLNSHRSWILTGQAYAYTVGITDSDRVMTPNPLFHANAQAYSTMASLAAGATLIIIDRFSASKLLDQARKYKANVVVLVQAVMPWLWEQPPRDNDRDHQIRTVVAGNIPAQIYRPFEKRFGVRFQTIYSLTEAVFAIMGPRPGTQSSKPGGIGVPMEHPDGSVKNEVKIVDDKGVQVDQGMQGEIIIRNPSTMIEYFKNKTATSMTKENGWVRTGDIGYKDEDGYFFFIGRQKEVIRRRGELISPGEIEAVLYSNPKIRECAVIGIPSGGGIGEEEVKAYVRPTPGTDMTPEEVWDWCKVDLAEFKIPRYLEFRDDLPKTAIGKIQKKKLKAEKEDLTEGSYDRLN